MKKMNKRTVRELGPEDIEEYLSIYLTSYPAFKDIGDEGREYKRQITLMSMKNDEHIHFTGLFEGDTLIATMKVIDFSMNIFGEMQRAAGLMALGVHPLHKKKGAALDMVRYFEDYTRKSGAIIALLLPFRMDFYRKMGYGFESRLYEYKLNTDKLPEQRDMSHMRYLEKSDFQKVLDCHKNYVRKNHGMIDKFEDEIRDMEEDTASRRVGYFDSDELTGYVAYHYVCENDTNYTLNRIEADELIYDNPGVLRALLGFLRMQADQDQNVVLRTGEEDFYHIFNDPADVSDYYVPFGCLQTNISTINVMHKILDPELFIRKTSYRRFPKEEIRVAFNCQDELTAGEKNFTVDFADGKWSVSGELGGDVIIRCKASDMASILMGSAEVGALARLGAIEISDASQISRLDTLFHAEQRPFSNTDF